MRNAKNLVMILVGIALGVALVLACDGEDGAPDAAAAGDAMGCDCLQAEPIERRIRTISEESMTSSDQLTVSASVSCGALASDAVLLGGSCDAGAVEAELLQLKSSNSGARAYACHWINSNLTNGAKVKATAICLVPEGTPLPDAGP